MPLRVLSIEVTPNPNARKLICSRLLTSERVSCFAPPPADAPALARALLSVSGVRAVMLLGDFITLTKSPESQWTEILRSVKSVVARFESATTPTTTPAATASAEGSEQGSVGPPGSDPPGTGA